MWFCVTTVFSACIESLPASSQNPTVKVPEDVFLLNTAMILLSPRLSKEQTNSCLELPCLMTGLSTYIQFKRRRVERREKDRDSQEEMGKERERKHREKMRRKEGN